MNENDERAKRLREGEEEEDWREGEQRDGIIDKRKERN